jgi:hypothetical protein
MMILRLPAMNQFALLLATGAALAIGVSGTAAKAQTQTQTQTPRTYSGSSKPSYGAGGPNVSYQQGPHTRVFITKRSWLDAGVEVLPGDRHFTDYAYPPALGYPDFARENKNAPIDREPMNPPSDMGGYPLTVPLPPY